MKETNGSGLKFIELRSFLARIKTDVLDISKVDRDNFWTIVNCVDSARTVIKEKNIRCKDLKLEPRDKSRIEKFPFFRSGVIIEFYLKSPPFAMELLNTGLFTKTFMYFTSIDSEQLKIIPFSSHYSLWVFLVDKQNHLNEFFKNLLQAPPANREWRIINFSMELAWNVGCDMIERVFNECNIQPALEYGLNSRSYKITNDDPENQWILKITYQNIKEFYHDYVIAQRETVSPDGSTCMQCRSGNCNCNGESEILRNGQCEACQNGTIPDEAGMNCVPCTSMECLCQSDSTSCDSPLNVPNVMDEIELTGRSRYHSALLAKKIRPAAQLCAAGSQMHCNELVNYCVLQHFDRTASSAFNIFDEARKYTNNWQSTWSPLFYDIDADSELNREVAINQIYKLHNGEYSQLEIVLVVYNLNGTLNRISSWRDANVQLCSDPNEHDMFTFGRRYKLSCDLSHSEILSKDHQLFYEAYVRYRDEQSAQEKLYAIPIVNRDLKLNGQSTNLGPKESNKWYLARVLLGESVAGVSADSTDKRGGEIGRAVQTLLASWNFRRLFLIFKPFFSFVFWYCVPFDALDSLDFHGELSTWLRDILHSIDGTEGALVLTRRFFAVDGYSLTMGNGTRLTTRFANAIHLHVQLQPSRDGKIYPPYLVIDYKEILKGEENDIQQAIMRISYDSNPSRHDRDLEITMAVLCPLSVIWAALCAYSWGRRAGRQTAVDISSIIQFLFFECSILGDVFFLVIFCMSAWIVFGYKEQVYFFYNVLNENQEQTILTYLIIALGLKFIALLHNNVMLILQETFFIDWEKPKIALASKTRSLTADIEKDRIEQPPVIWRTYMIANEWNELQQYRKTSVALQLVIFLFFYEFLGVKYFAAVEPGFTSHKPSNGYETILLTRLAVVFPLYLLIAFIQWIVQVIIVERFIADRFHNFIDLCSVANVSVLSLTHPLHGYYIHGRSVHGTADTGMGQMNDFLQRERDNLCGHRGLDVSTPDLQTLYVNLPQGFRKRYDEIVSMARQLSTTTATVISRNDAATTRVAGLVQVHAEMNNFLQSFIEHGQTGKSLKYYFLSVCLESSTFCLLFRKKLTIYISLFSGFDYLIRDRSLIEALLDLEVTVTTQTGNFLRDPSEVAFSRCFVYGNEWAWLSFESLLFVVSYLLFNSIHLSCLLVYVFSRYDNFLSY
ncbi:hypothetical protein WR25_24920 isoform B [Diploscapter pachys]|uniref:Meckelin n=1 Tax=Diploscapter pachys TaxID=2018661 RepID=A0A2A2L092_9BILA|nr:hypothetical protein WR25_24920 isoform B [Diploscapter pachys]